jgi:hypothetical protein
MNKTGIFVFSILAIMYGTFLPIYSVESEKKGECIEGNCQDGVGKFKYTVDPAKFDSNEYEGGWVNGLRSGHGKCIIKYKNDEIIFEGNFVEDIPNGNVSYIIRTDGREQKFEGEFKDGKENGHGIETWENGSIYNGMWVDGKKHGNGKLVYSDGREYTGDFKDGNYDGNGILEFSKNEKYEGEFLKGHFHGKGTYYYPDGSKYVGSWKDDKEEGEGTLYDSDGDISQQGKWVKGLFANPLNMIIKDAEEISSDEYYIYNLDVWSYFGLWDIYDTELKRLTYKKSKEYQKQLQELQDKKKVMPEQWYYTFLEKHFEKTQENGDDFISDFDIKRNGFHIQIQPLFEVSNGDMHLRHFRNSDDEEEYTHEENPAGVVFTPIPLSKAPYLGFDKKYHRGSLFLPMSQTQGLKIENNREKCNIYFMFKIIKSDAAERLLYASPVRVIVAHEDSGEVYYDNTFTSEK